MLAKVKDLLEILSGKGRKGGKIRFYPFKNYFKK